MPSSEFIEKAVEVINRILSESAFIFTDPMESEDYPDLEEWSAQGVSLQFSGYRSGALSLWAGEDFLRSAAANMLGIDEDSEKAGEKGMDALKEILNIIVGNLITAVFGSEPVFDLGIPSKLAPENITDDYAPDRAIWLEAEGNPVLFILNIEEE